MKTSQNRVHRNAAKNGRAPQSAKAPIPSVELDADKIAAALPNQSLILRVEMEDGQTVCKISISKSVWSEVCAAAHARGWNGEQFIEQALYLACRFYAETGATFIDSIETLKHRSTAMDGLWEYTFMGMEACCDPERPSHLDRVYDRVAQMHISLSDAMDNAIESLDARWEQLRK
jgi:hypothetical protein